MNRPAALRRPLRRLGSHLLVVRSSPSRPLVAQGALLALMPTYACNGCNNDKSKWRAWGYPNTNHEDRFGPFAPRV